MNYYGFYYPNGPSSCAESSESSGIIKNTFLSPDLYELKNTNSTSYLGFLSFLRLLVIFFCFCHCDREYSPHLVDSQIISIDYFFGSSTLINIKYYYSIVYDYYFPLKTKIFLRFYITIHELLVLEVIILTSFKLLIFFIKIFYLV